MDTGKKRGTKSDEPLKTKRQDSTEDVVSDSYEESKDHREVYDSKNEEVSDSKNEEVSDSKNEEVSDSENGDVSDSAEEMGNLEKEESIEKKTQSMKKTGGVVSIEKKKLSKEGASGGEIGKNRGSEGGRNEEVSDSKNEEVSDSENGDVSDSAEEMGNLEKEESIEKRTQSMKKTGGVVSIEKKKLSKEDAIGGEIGKNRGSERGRPQKQKKLTTKDPERTKYVEVDSYEESTYPEEEMTDLEKGGSIEMKKVAKKDKRSGASIEKKKVAKNDARDGDSIEKQKVEKKGARGGDSIERNEVAKKVYVSENEEVSDSKNEEVSDFENEEVSDSKNEEVSDFENEEVSDSKNEEDRDSIEKQKVATKGACGGDSIERKEVAKKDRDRSGGDSIKMKVEKKDKSGGGVDGPLLFFDLETTGLIRKREPCPHIIQIGAVRGKKEFKIYVRPKNPISTEASFVNGITYGDGVMRSGGEEVECVGIKEALKQFYHFISANGNGSVLVGHFIKSFDCKVLYHAVYRNKMIEEFSSVIKGCIDTCIVSRKVHPELGGHSLDKLLNYFFGEPRSGLHDALSDAQLTKKVFEVANMAPKTREFLFSWELVVCHCSIQPQSR